MHASCICVVLILSIRLLMRYQHVWQETDAFAGGEDADMDDIYGDLEGDKPAEGDVKEDTLLKKEGDASDASKSGGDTAVGEDPRLAVIRLLSSLAEDVLAAINRDASAEGSGIKGKRNVRWCTSQFAEAGKESALSVIGLVETLRQRLMSAPELPAPVVSSCRALGGWGVDDTL